LQIAVQETRDKIFIFIAAALGNWSSVLIFRTRAFLRHNLRFLLAPLDVFIGNIQSRIRMLAAAVQFQWLLDQQNELRHRISPINRRVACPGNLKLASEPPTNSTFGI